MAMCPFTNSTATNGVMAPTPCRADCALRVRNDCAFKVLAIKAYQEMHSSNLNPLDSK